MTRSTSDVARMLALIPWLLERPGASLGEAADAFGVDASTIRRDLSHLDFCGLPGLGGGDLFEVDIIGDRVVVGMADELRRPLRPTPAEALRLVLTVDAVAHLLGDEVPDLVSGLDRIRRALGVPDDVADVVDDVPEGLTEVRRAVDAGMQVELSYQGRSDDEPRRRLVDPWAVQVADGSWYLHGHDHGAGAARSFRLDRIASLSATGTPATTQVPDRLPLPAWEPSDDDLRVVLEVGPRARWIADAIVADEVIEGAAGAMTISLRTDAPGWIARLVLMSSGDARVVEPEAVASDVRRRATTALELLGGRG
ncbi:MAG: WYL domain-containing protein [Nitriliruptoraceae bacterium]